MNNADRYQVIKVCEQIESGVFELKYYCMDPHGLPFILGDCFIKWVLSRTKSERTAVEYINNVLMLLTYFSNLPQPLSCTASQKDVREGIRNYIQKELGWHMRMHTLGQNLIIDRPEICKKTGDELSKISLKTLGNRINSWKMFYRFLIDEGIFHESNPLEFRPQGNRVNDRFIPTMPPISGMTLEKQHARVVNTYFCISEGDWKPMYIGDISLPQRLMPFFFHLRDRIIFRILYETGCRISEAINLTIGDWRSLHGIDNGAKTINKGSGGQRTKRIHWSSATDRMIRNYVNHPRRQFDKFNRELSELGDNDPLFTNIKGCKITYKGFYKAWRIACKGAGLSITIHQLRHWFVTTYLHKVNEIVDSSQREAYRQKFIQYMGWKDHNTINIYDHYVNSISDDKFYELIDRGFHCDKNIAWQSSKDHVEPNIMKQISEYQKFINQDE